MNQTSVREVIDKLLIIQERDLRIMRCQREIDQIPQKSKKIESETSQARAAFQKAKDEFKAHQSEVKKVELEVESLRQKIAKLREQQFQIKSNEEFKVLNGEIARFNDDIKKLEEQEILFMEQVEKAQQREAEAQKTLAAMENTIKDRLGVLNERKVNLEVEVQQLTANRDDVAKDVAKELMAVYNRILENKRDQALVLVENSTCGGCHMHLPAHLICEIKKMAGLTACSFCGRILYLVH